jgi:serine/threonine protein kinase
MRVGTSRIPGLRVGALLGEGATGAVYEGTDADGRRVAVKVLHEHLAGDETATARFEREARNCSRIRSEYVARVLGAGTDPDGGYWVAYERLDGETLAARLAREGFLETDVAGRVVEQVLLGLEAAHAVGVVHRDIKPANIMLVCGAAGDRACILDFGASKHRPIDVGAAASESLTSATETIGTVSYMPPEQLGGAARVDARADLYATGVVAFRALTGELPFAGESQAAVMYAKLHGQARTLAAATGVEWPAALEDVIGRGMAREVERRFASAAKMRGAWVDAIARVQVARVRAVGAANAGQKREDDTLPE